MPQIDMVEVEVIVHYLCDTCNAMMSPCGGTLTNDGIVYNYACSNDISHPIHHDSIQYPKREIREVPFNARYPTI